MKKYEYYEKIKFKIGDLIVDTKNVLSGLVIDVLEKHIKIVWDSKICKLSKWETNKKIMITKEYKYYAKQKSYNNKK